MKLKRKADRGETPPDPRIAPETIVGAGTVFSGSLECPGLVRIEGICRGKVRTPGRVVVASGARAEATITASEVVIEGFLEGAVEGARFVRIGAGAIAIAEISTKRLGLARGARFDGRVTPPRE